MRKAYQFQIFSTYGLFFTLFLQILNPAPIKADMPSEENSAIIISEGATNPVLKAKQAIVMDFSTGTILLEKNAQARMVPSSMTKIMTSYLIEEKIKKGEASLDSQFIVSEKAWKMGGSKSFMPLGESVRLEDILKGIIIQSGNDACIVGAEGLFGSEEGIVEVMNLKAKEIGMNNTNFVNSSGWPATDHYSTAYDLALLGVSLIKDHAEFYPLYSEKYFTFGKDQKGNPITQGNRNPLLYKDVGCDGIKTGSTDDGGYGVVASFMDSERRYIMVINGLSSMQQRSTAALELLNWVKQNYYNKKLYSAGEIIAETSVWLGVKDKISLAVAEDVSIPILLSKFNEIDKKMDFLSKITAPIKEGDIIGKLHITTNNNKYVFSLIAKESIEEVGFFSRLKCYITSLWG